jgi:hypothetical protein
LGAVQTYLRRYLWVNAFEISEHDALDAVMGSDAPKKPEPVAAKPVAAAVKPAQAPEKKVELPGQWTLKPLNDGGTSEEWLGGLKLGTTSLLQMATTPDDVANIFKVNRSLFDRAKELDPAFYADLMTSFTTTKKSLTKE